MNDDAIIETAADWHGQIVAGTVDWDAFTDWLEAAPTHARAYDAVTLAEAALDAHRDDLAEAGAADCSSRAAPSRPVLGWAVGIGALAASLVVAASLLTPLRESAEIRESGDGAMVVALADGTRIALAPHSRLVREGDRMALDGAAVFAVPHRPGRTLSITAGGLTIRDIGTHFDLRVDRGTVRLSLDDGQVNVSGAALAAPVTVRSGEAMLFEPIAARLTLGRAATGATGDWQGGQLSYRDAPLPLVAADLARYGHRSLAVDGALAGMHFSGTLRLSHGHDPAQDLARLMALDISGSGDRAVLVRAR